MITEAIWTQNHHIKGSSRAAIRNFVLDKYTDVDENRIKGYLSSNLSKMLEDTEEGYPCLIRVDNMNYKLTPEWRKEWTKTYGKKRRQTRRKKRASDHPKHPRNAYLFYATEVRRRRQDEYPDKTFGQLTSLIADEWRNLSSKRKKKYEELQKKDKRRYRREMKEYEANKSSGSDSDSSSEGRYKRKRSRKSRSESFSEDSRSHSKKKKKRKTKSESSGSEEEKNRKKKDKKTTTSEEEKDKEKKT